MSEQDRFIVASSSGYPIPVNPGVGASNHQVEWMVLDRAYCHRVVYSSLGNKRTLGSKRHGTHIRRREDVAREVCRRLNERDRLGLTPTVVQKVMTEEELVVVVQEKVRELGREPTWSEWRSEGWKPSASSLQKRLGQWPSILERARALTS